MTIRFNRRQVLMGGAAAASLTLLPACGGGGSGSSGNTLRYLITDDAPFVKGTTAMIEAFQEQNEGVEVTIEAVPFSQLYQKIQTAVAVEAPWDVILADGPMMKNYIYNKILAPIEEYFEEADYEQWPERLIENGRDHAGHFYGPPVRDYAPVLFYNKELMRDGLQPPSDPEEAWTLEEAMDAFRACTVAQGGSTSVWGVWPSQSDVFGPDSTIGGFRRGADEEGSNTFNGMAEDGITVSGYFDTPEAIKGYEWIQSLFIEQVSPVEPTPGMFESGKAAFCFAPDSMFGKIEQAGGDVEQFGTSPLPVFEGLPGMTQIGSYHYSVLDSSPNTELAAQFCKFAASTEGARLQYEVIQQFPANLPLLEELPEYAPDGVKGLFPKIAEYNGRIRIETPGYSEFNAVHNRTTQDIARGAKVADIMHSAAEEIDAQIAKYEGWKDEL